MEIAPEIGVGIVAISNLRMLACSFRKQENMRFPPHPLSSVPPSKQSAQFAYPNFSEEA